MAHFFLSYASQDYDRLKSFISGLESLGHVIWIDKTCIPPGREWEKAIKEAIDKSDGAILLLTSAFMESKFIREWEWRWIKYKFFLNEKPSIYPILVDDIIKVSDDIARNSQDNLAREIARDIARMKNEIVSIQWIDVTNGDYERGVSEFERCVPSPVAVRNKTIRHYLEKLVKNIKDSFQNEGMAYYQIMFNPKVKLTSDEGLSETVEVSQEEMEKEYDIKEVIKNFPRLIILGDPGMGKSTALDWVTMDYAHNALNALGDTRTYNEVWIPIKGNLKRYEKVANLDALGNMVNFIKTKSTLEIVSDELESLKFWENFRVLLILDGLNEIMDPEIRNHCILGIKELCRSTKYTIKCIISSRKHNFELEDFRGDIRFKPLEITKLSRPDIEAFVQCYGLTSAEAEDFAKQLDMKLLRLAQNPMLLSILVRIYKRSQTHKLPRSRAKILKEFLIGEEASEDIITSALEKTREGTGLLRRRLGDFSESVSLKSNKALALKKDFCAAIALVMQKERLSLEQEKIMNEIVKHVLVRSIYQGFNDPLRVLSELKNNSILEPVYQKESDKTFWEFRHQLYQEYFVAQRIAEEWETQKHNVVNSYIKDVEWHEAIALAAGILEEEVSIHE